MTDKKGRQAIAIGNLLLSVSIAFVFWAWPRWAFVGYISYLILIECERRRP